MRRAARYAWIVPLVLVPFACAGESAPPDRIAEQPLPPPFQLTPDEQKEIDCLLDRWEQWNARVKTFDCKFHRWIYDLVFNPPCAESADPTQVQ